MIYSLLRELSPRCKLTRWPHLAGITYKLTTYHGAELHVIVQRNCFHLCQRYASQSAADCVCPQIRGFLSRFHQILPAGRAFDKCTACSPIVSVVRLCVRVHDFFQFLCSTARALGITMLVRFLYTWLLSGHIGSNNNNKKNFLNNNSNRA